MLEFRDADSDAQSPSCVLLAPLRIASSANQLSQIVGSYAKPGITKIPPRAAMIHIHTILTLASKSALDTVILAQKVALSE